MRLLLTTLSFLTALTTLRAQVPSYVPTVGLVGWWPFNGNANDESGTGNNGSVNGAVLTTDRFGNIAQAFVFDGVDDRIEVAHHQTLNCSSVSISVWFNTNNYVASNGFGPHILSKREITGWGNSYQMNVGIDEAQNACWADWSILGDGGIYYSNSTVLNTNNWYNLVYTHDGNEVKLFLNGSLVQTIVSPGLLSFNTLPLWFGARPNAGNNSSWFNGKLDDIGIWNRALTPAEIQALYVSQPLPPCLSPESVSFSGLNGAYLLGDAPVTLMGSPAGGVFIGPGISGNTFSPGAAGLGTHGIMYLYEDAQGCISGISLCTDVTITVGIGSDNRITGGLKIFPNPNRGQFTVELELTGMVGLQVFDARGALVHNEAFTAYGSRTQRTLDLSNLAKGSYTLQVEHTGQRLSQVVLVE